MGEAGGAKEMFILKFSVCIVWMAIRAAFSSIETWISM